MSPGLRMQANALGTLIKKKNNQTNAGPMQHHGSGGSHKYQVKERMNLDVLTMWTRQKFTVVLTRVAGN